ncbi:hypothetical protein BDW68DRAFT_31801 [Aspergillus falconensis]
MHCGDDYLRQGSLDQPYMGEPRPATVHGLTPEKYLRQNSSYPLEMLECLFVTVAADLIGSDRFPGPLHHSHKPVVVVIMPYIYGDQSPYRYPTSSMAGGQIRRACLFRQVLLSIPLSVYNQRI